MEYRHDFDEVVDRRGTDCKKYSQEFYPAGVIPMWIADTDFKAPRPVVEAIAARAAQGVFGYPVSSSRLREAVAGWEKRRFAFPVAPEEVEFVPGVIPGVIAALRAFSRPGDQVIIQTPAYPPFAAGIENNGRRVLRNPLILENGKYRINFREFEEQCRDSRTRLFILCNPHNPTGRVFTREELCRLGEICLANQVLVVSDEIHCDLVYPGARHLPFASLSPRFSANCVSFLNPSKTFNLAGLRTAAMVCQNPLLKSRVHQVLLANKAVGETIFGTLGLCVAYEECDSYADQVVQYLYGNLEYAARELGAIPGIRLIMPDATFLLWLDCRELGLAQPQLMEAFVAGAGVGVQSGTDFGPEGAGFVRMNIGCPRSLLREALRRLRNRFV